MSFRGTDKPYAIELYLAFLLIPNIKGERIEVTTLFVKPFQKLFTYFDLHFLKNLMIAQ